MKLNGAKSVILIEDNDLLREFMEIYLELSDYQVVSRSGYADEVCFSKEFLSNDVFIIDKNIPMGSGIDLSRNILNHAPSSKILLISGDFSENNKSEMQSLGVNYLTKPFTADELILSLDKFKDKV